MSEIRSLRDADIPDIARLFQNIFRDARSPVSPALESYLRRLYTNLAGIGTDDAHPSLVLTSASSSPEITGFIGVNILNYTYQQKTYKTGIVGTLMVANHQQDPLGGARLMRHLTDSSYDLLITETASEVTAAMWKRLNALQLTNYSLDWLRIIRPCGFMLETAAGKLPPLRSLRPLARLYDQRKRRNMGDKELRWSGTPQNWLPGQALNIVPVDREEFGQLFEQLSVQFACRPVWQPQLLADYLQDALIKPDYGTAHLGKIQTKSGKVLGVLLYHLAPDGIARVLQFLSDPKAQSQAIDALIHHAGENGAVAIRGRTQPAMMEAMLGKRIAFTHLASTMVWARDPAMLEPFQRGEAMLNGFAGEHWSRLTGNSF